MCPKIRHGFAFFCLALFTTGHPLVFADGEKTGGLSWKGLQRTWLLHVPPSYDSKHPVALVIVLHGGGGAAAGAVRMSGMSEKSDKEGFLVVYPNGTGPLKDKLLTWNACNCCGYAYDHQIDDVGFVGAMIDQLEKDYSIDPKRVYITGLSNGAKLAYRLGCQLSEKIAAIAPVAGSLDTDQWIPKQPVSVIIFHGTQDQHVLYEGGKPKTQFDRHERIDSSVAFAVSFWVKQDGCSPDSKRVKKGHIISDTYTNGKNGTEVVLHTIQGQGHAWPGGTEGIRNGNVDPPTAEISATDEMWSFFQQHSKK